MNDYVVIIYNGEQVSVPKEVADFLGKDEVGSSNLPSSSKMC